MEVVSSMCLLDHPERHLNGISMTLVANFFELGNLSFNAGLEGSNRLRYSLSASMNQPARWPTYCSPWDDTIALFVVPSPADGGAGALGVASLSFFAVN